jgi:hypothetical protein
VDSPEAVEMGKSSKRVPSKTAAPKAITTICAGCSVRLRLS